MIEKTAAAQRRNRPRRDDDTSSQDQKGTMEREERHNPFTERTEFDAGMCSYANGYAQIDTKQDAPYFGTWVNPSTRRIVSLAEGDITIETAEGDEELVTTLRALAEWNEKAGWGFGIDPGTEARMEAEFKRLGVSDLLH